MARFLVVSVLGRLLVTPPLRAAEKPVKVFILAGQSNMEGQGFIKADPKRNEGKGSLEYLTKGPSTANKYNTCSARKAYG